MSGPLSPPAFAGRPCSRQIWIIEGVAYTVPAARTLDRHMADIARTSRTGLPGASVLFRHRSDFAICPTEANMVACDFFGGAILLRLYGPSLPPPESAPNGAIEATGLSLVTIDAAGALADGRPADGTGANAAVALQILLSYGRRKRVLFRHVAVIRTPALQSRPNRSHHWQPDLGPPDPAPLLVGFEAAVAMLRRATPPLPLQPATPRPPPEPARRPAGSNDRPRPLDTGFGTRRWWRRQ